MGKAESASSAAGCYRARPDPELLHAKMLTTIEVEIDREGRIHPVDPKARLPAGRALLTLLAPPADETALLAEAALADDWLKPEEDAAWAELQPDR